MTAVPVCLLRYLHQVVSPEKIGGRDAVSYVIVGMLHR
jgi:hypothetical protein